MADSRDDESARALQEQLAFLERELEHHRDQLKDLWNELADAKQQIARLRGKMDREGEPPGEP